LNQRRTLFTLVAVGALCALAYFQFRNWDDFDWSTFWRQTRQADPLPIAGAIFIIYFGYYLRALRWHIFLRPTKPTPISTLLPPTIVGFTGLALLGRPGELLRPYLIAKRADVSVTSQFAVWWVERIFDTASTGLLLAIAIFYRYERFRGVAGAMLLIVTGMVLFALLLWYRGEAIADYLDRRARPLRSRRLAYAARRIRNFSDGLHTIHDVRSLVQIIAVSLALWGLIALNYLLVTRAYPDPVLSSLDVPEVLLLMGASMAGSILQLPAVGGGAQLATIAVLVQVHRVPYEPAVSCGILLWLIGFVAIVPIGLSLAHREHISLRAADDDERRFEDQEPA
jgi:hypothetical protein